MVNNASLMGQNHIQRFAGDLKAGKQEGKVDPEKLINDLTPKQLEKLGFDVDHGILDFTGWSPSKIKTELKAIVQKADPTDPPPTDIKIDNYEPNDVRKAANSAWSGKGTLFNTLSNVANRQEQLDEIMKKGDL